MTRDNALIYIHGMATGHHPKATKNHYNDIAQAVNDIYNDVESRTCENCSHSSAPYRIEDRECLKLRIYVDAGFGCNDFERIDSGRA